MMEGHSRRADLDETGRYCLVDAMDVVDVYREAPDVVDGVRDAAGDRSLLVIPGVAAEAAGVCKELSGRGWDDLRTLESEIMSGMAAPGAPVAFAHLPGDVQAAAASRRADAECANPDGARLSPVGCMLPCAAAGTANVDVMTEHRALRGAVEAECGAGRACTSRKRYHERCARTAWFVWVVSAGAGLVRWQARNGRMECRSGKALVAVLEVAGDRWGAVRECSIGKPGAAAAIGTFYRTALPDDCCRCSPEGGGRRCAGAPDCACVYGDGVDGGLDKDEAWKFLRAMPGNERGDVLAQARSLGCGA